MALVINYVNGINYPAVNCDVCKQFITKSAPGIVVFRFGGGGVKTVHKGECDRALELMANTHFSWQELPTYLEDLAHNVGVDVDERHPQLDEEGRRIA
jgi:hypothetical protein